MASKRHKLTLEARRRRRKRKDRKATAEEAARQHRTAKYLEDRARRGEAHGS